MPSRRTNYDTWHQQREAGVRARVAKKILARANKATRYSTLDAALAHQRRPPFPGWRRMTFEALYRGILLVHRRFARVTPRAQLVSLSTPRGAEDWRGDIDLGHQDRSSLLLRYLSWRHPGGYYDLLLNI